MDTISHGFWAIALVKGVFKKGHLFLAFLFGLIPDLIPGIISFCQIFLFKSSPLLTPEGINFYSSYSLISYYFLHSFIFILVVFGLIYLIKKKVYVWMLGWPLHVLMDIFFHSSGTFGTRLFYPLSNFQINGIDWWTHPIVSIINWIVLIVVLFFVFRKEIKKKFKKRS